MLRILFGFVLTITLLWAPLAESQELGPAIATPTQRRTPLGFVTSMGGLLGAAGGFALAWGPAIQSLTCDRTYDRCTEKALPMVITSWGTPLTTALGVWTAGHRAGGGGNYGVTLAGAALGTVAAVPFSMLLESDSLALQVMSFAAFPVLQWAGAVVAYHLSHNAHAARSAPPGESAWRWLPQPRVEPGGASLWLGGAF